MSSDDHQVSVAGDGGYVRGVSMFRGEYVQGAGIPGP